MSIRLKLFLVIVILITSFVVPAATYFILLAPLQKISDEEASLTDLHTAFLVQELAAQRLATTPFVDAVKSFKMASASTTEAFLAVQGLKILPSLNSSIRQSLATINKLKTQLDQNMLQFRDDVQTISNVFDRFPAIDPNQATLFGLVETATRQNEVEGTGQVLGVTEVQTWIAQLDVVSKGFADAGSVIDQQYASIDTEVKMVENRSRLLSLLAVAVLIGLTVLLASFVANRIVRSIRLIERNIFLMKEGDLTLAFSLDVQDEVGALSRNLDQFLAGLRDSMDLIKATSAENLKIKENLVVTTEQTSASATQISSNAESIDRGVGSEQQAGVGQSPGDYRQRERRRRRQPRNGRFVPRNRDRDARAALLARGDFGEHARAAFGRTADPGGDDDSAGCLLERAHRFQRHQRQCRVDP